MQSLNLIRGSIFQKKPKQNKNRNKKKKGIIKKTKKKQGIIKKTNKQKNNYPKKKKGFSLKPDDVIVMSSNVHEWKGKPRFIV